jgi:hypothetical protein
MPEAVEKPEDRDVDELLEGLKESMQDVKDGNTSTIDEVREEIEGK